MQERQEPSLESTSTPPPTPPAAPPRRRRRWLRWLMMAIALSLIAVGALLGIAWWWAGQADSLQRTLARVASWMPADQKLEADGIEGSLRHGGRIDWLRWTSPALQVEIKGADIAWRLQPLLQRELRFGRVNMDELRIRSTPQPKEDTPTTPLQSLQLPMRLDIPVRIEKLVWEGPPETTVTALYGQYRYTGSHHELQVSSLHYAGGLYEAQAKLQAAAPMQLEAQLQGAIEAALPHQPSQTLPITASADIRGTLATEAAKLTIKAQAHTTHAANTANTAGTPAPTDNSLSANVSAIIRPWLAQPVEQAQADLRHVDAALFMSNGLHTDLSGTLQAGPDGTGWKLHADLHNERPGPWDQQALPVRAVVAEARFDGVQTWTLEQARIFLGKANAPADRQAQLQAQGSLDTQRQTIEATAIIDGLNPAEIYSSLDAAPISGRLQASTDAEQQVQFALNLQSQPARNAKALRIASARAEGQWKAPILHIRDLQLDAWQAQLQANALSWNHSTQTIEGTLQAQLPGAQLDANLSAGPATGQGQLQLQISAAEQLGQWLSRLPLGTDPLAGAQLAGNASATLNWRGGWQKLQQRLQNPAAPLQASGLQLEGKLQAHSFSYRPANGIATQLPQLQLQFSGSPESLRINLDGKAQQGAQSVALQTALTAGLWVAQGAAPTDWQAKIDALSARWSPQGSDSQAWQIKLGAPVSASQRTTGNPVRSTRIQASGSQLVVTPPSSQGAQTASIEWQPLLLRQAGNGAWALQSQGRLSGIPLAWVDAFSPNPKAPLLASAGVGGDLVVQGSWNIDTTGRQLRADVLLERASGDIRLLVEDTEASNITVIRSTGASEINAQSGQVQARTLRGLGMRTRLQELRLQVSAQGNDLRGQLVWNSERAGQIQADVRSQLRATQDGFSWPENAPINGTIQAALPNIGIWALVAPPGWRVSGTFNANATLSGTRSAPRWDGQLSADELSVLSLLDGVDLKNGRLRARLQGTRLDITELYLQGGEGSSTRILGQSGNLTSAPKDGGTLKGSGFVEYNAQPAADSPGMRMDIRAVAERLQVLVRGDRQLSVSGGLQATLERGRFSLVGDLKVDRAAIMLADSSAPTLDSDVHITSAAIRQAAQEKADQAAARMQKAQDAGSVQAAQPPHIQVQLDLGNDFALQGYGITTRLEGQLQVSNGPRITGEIHTVNGRYRAWGQSLDVQSGTVRFNGPYANPAIDIVAVRPNIEVKAGVKVTGSASDPRVTLFSEPEMSDAEKLSWVVMGRSAAAGGAETALLQQAALALLSGGGGTGNFASQLGFDEVGLKGPSEDGTQGAAVTVGKRLSKDLYVAYEQSLSGAMGTLFIFYDLSRRLTLRGQTGVQTAVDLIYTRSKD